MPHARRIWLADVGSYTYTYNGEVVTAYTQPNQQSTTTCTLPEGGTYTLRCFDAYGDTWNGYGGTGGQLELIVASGDFEWEGVYCDQTEDDGFWCARVASDLPPSTARSPANAC